jgi:hydrogenase expression/formation protein HypC
MCLAVPGKIISVTNEDSLFRSGKVDFGGVTREVSLSCLPEAKVGDYVIVHVGMAISRLDEEEAKRTLDDFAALRELSSEGAP